MRPLTYLTLMFTLILSACNTDNDKTHLLNDRASIPLSFKFDQLGLKVMAAFINKRSRTMSVLYANPLALSNVVAGTKNAAAGEMRALVTWHQQADDHWFGAKIPGALQSVEVVKTNACGAGLCYSYQKYNGTNLYIDSDTSEQQRRITYILAQEPAIMP